jgi:PPK2 family polyphosphate:nucleotide phosphotransferase
MADDITKRIARFIEPFRVSPGADVRLAKDFDPAFKAGIEKKKDGLGLLEDGISLLAEYQQRLAAQATHGVVVVLQALDAAGKDGTIRHVMSGVNPQGVRVESFKVPSARELDQDYLRRYQERLPARGEIGIFNRSHYEEVLVVRVHPENLAAQKLPPEAREHHVWKRRYHAINDWERYLTENGFRIVKLFLNLSKEEQRRRFLRRIDLPEHNWKFSGHDVQERRHWDAYQDASRRCSRTRARSGRRGTSSRPTASGSRVSPPRRSSRTRSSRSIRATPPSARTRCAICRRPSASSRPRRPTAPLRIRSRPSGRWRPAPDA